MPEKKIICALAKALSDEGTHIRKLTIAHRLSATVSLVILFLLLYSSLYQHNILSFWFAIASFFAGVFLALSAHFKSCLRQWPILRRFLNHQAVQKAASNEAT